MTLTVFRQQPACTIKLGMVPNGGEEIKDLAIVGVCVPNSICREERKFQGSRNSNCCLIAPFLFTLIVSLQFNINVLRTEDSYDSFNHLTSGLFTAAC
jgi:hypothetical protein